MLAVHIYLMEGQGMKEFFGFHKMISAIIIKVLYVIGAIVLTIGGIIAPFLDGDYVLLEKLLTINAKSHTCS